MNPRSTSDSPEYDRPSKTQVKQAMLELQGLGAELAVLPQIELDAIDMDERLREAIDELRRLTAHGARKRQMQYVGKLLRTVEVEPLRQALAAVRQGRAHDARLLHEVERWRERVLADDDGLDAFLQAYPASDTPQLHGLVRNARREQQRAESTGGARKGRFYRELFQKLRAVMQTPGS